MHRSDPWLWPVAILVWLLAVLQGWFLEEPHTLGRWGSGAPYLFLLGSTCALGFLWLFSFAIATIQLFERIRIYLLNGTGMIVLWAVAAGLFRDPLAPWQAHLSASVFSVQKLLFVAGLEEQNPDFMLLLISSGATLGISICINCMLFRVRLAGNKAKSLQRLAQVYPRSYPRVFLSAGLLILLQFWIGYWPPPRSYHEHLQQVVTVVLVTCFAYSLTYWLATFLRYGMLKFLLIAGSPLLLVPAARHFNEFFGIKTDADEQMFAYGFLAAHVIFSLLLLLTRRLPCRLPASDRLAEPDSPKPGPGRRHFRWLPAGAFLVLLVVAHRLPRHFDVPQFVVDRGNLRSAQFVARLRDANHGSFFLPRSTFWIPPGPELTSVDYFPLLAPESRRLGGGVYILRVDRRIKDRMPVTLTQGATFFSGTFVVEDHSLVTSADARVLQLNLGVPTNFDVRLDGTRIDSADLQLPNPIPRRLRSIEVVGGKVDSKWLQYVTKMSYYQIFNDCQFAGELEPTARGYWMVNSPESLQMDFPKSLQLVARLETLRSLSNTELQTILDQPNGVVVEPDSAAARELLKERGWEKAYIINASGSQYNIRRPQPWELEETP